MSAEQRSEARGSSEYVVLMFEVQVRQGGMSPPTPVMCDWLAPVASSCQALADSSGRSPKNPSLPRGQAAPLSTRSSAGPGTSAGKFSSM